MNLILKHFQQHTIKSLALDIFILIYSISPFLFTFLFTLPWVNKGADTALLLYQVSFMMLFTALTISIPQLNTYISRTMILWIFLLNILLATMIMLRIRMPIYGYDYFIIRHIRDILVLVISAIICKNKYVTYYMTRLKQLYVENK